MQSLVDCLELDITRYKKTDVVKLDELEFLFRTKNRVLYIFELSTKRCVLVTMADKNKVLNFLVERLEDVKKAVVDFHDRTSTMQQTESGQMGNILQ